MSFDVNAAKKAGYSQQEIDSFLKKAPASKNFDAQAAQQAGYSDQEISDFLGKQNISKTRSVISAPIKGVLKGAEELTTLADPAKLLMQQLTPHKQPLLNQVVERVLPTKDEATEQYLERAGRLVPSAALGGGGIVGTILSAAAGAGLGHLAKQEGVGEAGQGAAEAVGMGLPGIAKAAGKAAASLVKSPVEKFTSGLTKPRAVGAKLSERAIVTPDMQSKSIDRLNQEASKIAGQTVERELPLAKQIKEGIDFESQFEKQFGELQKAAEKANPNIDTTPVGKFFSETAQKYRGLPKPHPEAVKILQEIKAYSKRPPTELEKLLRVYRSNNKKIKGIYETSRLTGKQQEFVDFLVDYNRNIAKSIENTLPADSQWMKQFKDTNSFYKNYKDTQKTLSILEPILEQKATPASIEKFASDPRLQKKLELSMGKQGASEISQLAKDIGSATEAIKRIPAKELKWYDNILPLSIFIPYGQIPGGFFSAKKGLDWARRGYGWFLSTPARRSAYGNALKALKEGNRSLYLKSAQELENLRREEKED